MRVRRPSLAIVAFACSACASTAALRSHAERGDPLVTTHTAAPLGPAAGLVLVNPLACFTAGGGSSSGSGYAGVAYAAVMVACVGVLGAVDLVALPVQAARRHHQQRAIEGIALTCPLADPAAQVADLLSGEMVREFHFSPPPALDATANLTRAVTLEVRTTRFTRSSRIRWEAALAFRDADGEMLWRDHCAAEAPVREFDAFEHECEAARAEIAALADQCVERVAHRLRERWNRDAGRSPAAGSATSEEADRWPAGP